MEARRDDPRGSATAASPEHGWRGLSAQPRARPFRKVQIIYYLCRNGQLEHPHFLELTHLPNHHPRLRDVTSRLTVLRGSAMPSLYSWSCKRAYRNGFVWNDLAEDDLLHPAHGAEYILKGSEIVPPDRLRRILPATTQRREREAEEKEDEEEEDSPEPTASSSSSGALKAEGGAGTASPAAGSGRRVPAVVLRMIACGSLAAAAKGTASGLLLGRRAEAETEAGGECFSGSVAEETASEGKAGGSGPLVSRSTSFDEERSDPCRLGEAIDDEKEEERSIRGKCMPSRRWMKSSAVCKKQY